MRRHHLVAALLLFSPLLLCAQEGEKVTVTGQLRLRSELDDRGLTTDETVLAHLLRSRLRVTARPVVWATILAELQDSRHLGAGDPASGQGTTDVHAEGLDMRQAFAQI